jgi:hypothetical protein
MVLFIRLFGPLLTVVIMEICIDGNMEEGDIHHRLEIVMNYCAPVFHKLVVDPLHVTTIIVTQIMTAMGQEILLLDH